jgi:hypothetical protein
MVIIKDYLSTFVVLGTVNGGVLNLLGRRKAVRNHWEKTGFGKKWLSFETYHNRYVRVLLKSSIAILLLLSPMASL